MKKTIALIMALLLTLSCISGALAERARYANTKAVMEKLDDEGIIYTLCGVDDQNDEEITVRNSGDNCDYTMNLFLRKTTRPSRFVCGTCWITGLRTTRTFRKRLMS